jgi:hypothetical protein
MSEDTNKYPVVSAAVRADRKARATAIRAEISRLETVWANRDATDATIKAAATVPVLRTAVAAVAMEVARIARDVAAIARQVGGEDR